MTGRRLSRLVCVVQHTAASTAAAPSSAAVLAASNSLVADCRMLDTLTVTAAPPALLKEPGTQYALELRAGFAQLIKAVQAAPQQTQSTISVREPCLR